MLRTLPLILWRHTSLELWRLIVLTATVLVTVIAFAAAVKPLADGKLGPLDTLRFMLLAIPPMLQYALPFAAGFGATLAYHRFSADNEVLAAHAGGISHRSLLMPALASGLILSAVLLVLSNQAIPRFLRKMEELVRQDATRLLVASIRRAEPIRFGTSLVYADEVQQLGPDPSSGAFERLWLHRVLAVELDDAGEIRWEGTARDAIVWLTRGTGEPGESGASDTVVLMRLEGVVGRPAGQLPIEKDWANLEPFLIPNALSDDPKFLTFGELRGLRREPERMNFINESRRRLAAHLAERATTDALATGLRSVGSVALVEPDEAGEGAVTSAVLRASDIAWDPVNLWWTIRPPAEGRPITLTRYLADGRVQEVTGTEGWLRTDVRTYRGDRPVRLTLHLSSVTARGAGESAAAGDASGQRAAKEFFGLSLERDPAERLMELSSVELLALADQRPGDDYVKPPADRLRSRLERLYREVVSKEHERAAMSVACLVMVLLGSIMAMRLRESLPLAVYLWSFFPALGAVLTINAGQQMTHDFGVAGLAVLWGGVGLLSAFALAQLVRLARH